jgi:hypothetical protein
MLRIQTMRKKRKKQISRCCWLHEPVLLRSYDMHDPFLGGFLCVCPAGAFNISLTLKYNFIALGSAALLAKKIKK